jgi:aryl-alcohol dehydrogenase-like predicted oxidoreductase
VKVSAISYGNWVTHGSQVEADQVTARVRAALEAGITTFDRGHICERSRRDDSGRCAGAERRESIEILTKVFGATGPGGRTTAALSRKHIHESINASLTRVLQDPGPAFPGGVARKKSGAPNFGPI